MPTTGQLYQLSYVYDKHGYEPTQGTEITSVPTVVTGTKSRVVYARPHFDRERRELWDTFTYSVTDKNAMSPNGTVALVSPLHILVESNFILSSEGWSIAGNKDGGTVKHDETSMGVDINRFIYSSDNLRNMDENGDDKNVWYFVAPSKFNGWWGLAYKGYLDFHMTSFTGDFSSQDLFNKNGDLNMVEIECITCNYRRGIIIGFPLSSTAGFSGSTSSFSIELHERAGWLRKPKNPLHPWSQVTRCEIIEVLSSISSLKILGDFTRWYESIAIDNVRVRSKTPALRRHLPTCAQNQPDGSNCSCI